MWNELSNDNKSEYQKMILAFASLSEMFAQKAEEKKDITPIINSKYQETVFQRVFNATAEDIQNTPFDASLVQIDPNGEINHYLIGIKTFGFKTKSQKVAQFKSKHNDWAPIIKEMCDNANGLSSKEEIDKVNQHLYEQLARNIASIRNASLDSATAKILGFSVLDDDVSVQGVYHVLMPCISDNTPKIHVGEDSYDKIDIDNIRVKGCTNQKHPTNFEFEDGNHVYRFTSADTQLFMHFNNEHIIKESWDVKYAEDAYEIFVSIANRVRTQHEDAIIESHIWKIEVHPYSGLNSFFGLSSKMGPGKRKQKIEGLKEKFNASVRNDILDKVVSCLHVLNDDTKTPAARERERAVAMQLSESTNNATFIKEVESLAFRPMEELYIPVPNAKEFHLNHPNFFGKGIGQLTEKNKLPLPKEKNSFTLVLEPSKDEIKCFITQDSGKAIESAEKQSILGNWLLRKVFQLKKYEPLTQKRLEEMGINGIELYKTKDSKIHLRFTWIDDVKDSRNAIIKDSKKTTGIKAPIAKSKK